MVTSCVGNSLPKHIIEGKIDERVEVTGERGRRRKLLADGKKIQDVGN